MAVAVISYDTALSVSAIVKREVPCRLWSYRYGCEPQGFHVQVNAPVRGAAFTYHLPQDFTSGLCQHGIDKEVLFFNAAAREQLGPESVSRSME